MHVVYHVLLLLPPVRLCCLVAALQLQGLRTQHLHQQQRSAAIAAAHQPASGSSGSEIQGDDDDGDEQQQQHKYFADADDDADDNADDEDDDEPLSQDVLTGRGGRRKQHEVRVAKQLPLLN